MIVSIITVCLNSEHTIEQTIRSVIDQKNINIEYIIIDGGSKDQTLDIIEKYEDKIDIVVSEADNGIYDAMNKGISLSSGDVIGIINSDDWYEPGVFKKIELCFLKSEADIVYGRLNLISETGESSILIPGEIEKMRYEMVTPHPTVFIKKAIYNKYGMFLLKYKIAADYELMLRMFTAGVKFCYCDDVLANFRIGGISALQGRKCIEETLVIAESYLPLAPTNYQNALRDIILHKWKGVHFLEILDEYPDKLSKIIGKKQKILLCDKIAIFGVGAWGVKTYKALLSMNIQILFFVDNNYEKWGQIREGIKIFSPEILRTFKGILLVTIEKFSEEILCQVKAMKNSDLHCITWEEIVEESID